MPTDNTTAGGVPLSRALRHYFAVVLVCLALGAVAAWGYAERSAPTYTSTAAVLVNPSVGNPYAPTPSSVRQDELTSLETEAEVARSAEVLGAVAGRATELTAGQLAARVQVTVPPNTQVLDISFSSTDPVVARRVTNAVANAYLDNRARRFEEANSARIERVETQTLLVVKDLRAATAASHVGTAAERSFQAELADALRNELVNLRAQRTALENSESPAGAVISPASVPQEPGLVSEAVLPAGGALAGLALGCLLALLLERTRGSFRSTKEVEATGLPVVAVEVSRRARLGFSRRGERGTAFRTAVRRLRAGVMALESNPRVISVVPAGSRAPDRGVAEAVAESFAKAGRPVVLVRTDGQGLPGERGLAQVLLDDTVEVLDLLQPSQEPLLQVLPAGTFTPRSRELLLADRLRTRLTPLTDSGHLVVIASPGLETVDGEAVAAASDLTVLVVTVGVTRHREVARLIRSERAHWPAMAVLVVRRHRSSRSRQAPLALDTRASDPQTVDAAPEVSVTQEDRTPAKR